MLKTLMIMGDALGIICMVLFWIGGLIEDLQFRCYEAHLKRIHK